MPQRCAYSFPGDRATRCFSNVVIAGSAVAVSFFDESERVFGFSKTYTRVACALMRAKNRQSRQMGRVFFRLLLSKGLRFFSLACVFFLGLWGGCGAPWVSVTEDFTFFETQTVEAEIFGVKRTANGFYSCSWAYLGFSGVSYGFFVSGYPRFRRGMRPGSLRLLTMHVVSVDGDTRSRVFLRG